MPFVAIQFIKRMSRRAKMGIAMSVDACIASIALWLTYAAPSFSAWPPSIAKLWWLLPVASVLTVGVFYAFRLYHTIIRFAGSRFFLNSMVASVVVSWLVGVIGLINLYQSGAVPTAIFVIYPFYLMVGTAGARLVARRILEMQLHPDAEPNNTVIYGAGSGGTQLYAALRFGDSKYKVLAFIDSDPSTHGHVLNGLKVHSPEELPALIQRKKIQTVLLAIPSLDALERAKIIKELRTLNINVETTPTFAELINQQATFSDLRTPSIADILTRTEVKADERLASTCVVGKAVLVTGAGGSIGAELSRQIVQRAPSKIVLFDIAESSLFFIEQELLKRTEQLKGNVEVVPILGSVVDKQRLQEVLLEHDIDSVFHAAAYKHVPLLETNPLEAARNNIIGTKNVYEASEWANCSSLVIVSTDKAVRPTSFMGATKRVAELIVQAMSNSKNDLQTCIVRFGNVLGSSGSVVPIFQEQITSGGPVTVTNPNATRYFMTIPEAAQLILQAGALAEDANVFVLEMGEPIKIIDLAKRMIELQGKTVKDAENPIGDVEIKITSLRPGEKLHEELAIDGNLVATPHPMIRRSIEQVHAKKSVLNTLTAIEKSILGGGIDEVVDGMQQLIEGFEPSWLKITSNVSIEFPTKIEAEHPLQIDPESEVI